MKVYPKLKLRYPFCITNAPDGFVAVGIEDGADSYHGVIKLENEPAVFMFKKLVDGITLPELILACMTEFKSGEINDVGPKVIEFLNALNEQQLLKDDFSYVVKGPENEKS